MNRLFQRSIVGLVLTLVLAMVLSAPVARAAMAAPTWTVGDYWVYDLLGTSVIPDIGGTGTMRWDVVGVGPLNVGSGEFSAYRLRLTISVNSTTGNTTTTVTFTGDAWFRTSDLALARMSLSGSILFFPFSATITHNPPLAFQWPLDAGLAWSVTSSQTSVVTFFNTTQTTTSTVTTQFAVLPSAPVAVPAGSFATTSPVRQTDEAGDYTISYWAEAAGNSVRQTSYDSLGIEQGSMDLISYRLQGGGFLGTQILGLALLWWLVILAVVLVVVVGVAVMMRRRRPQAPVTMPPYQAMYPTEATPPGQVPPGYPPMGPPPQP